MPEIQYMQILCAEKPIVSYMHDSIEFSCLFSSFFLFVLFSNCFGRWLPNNKLTTKEMGEREGERESRRKKKGTEKRVTEWGKRTEGERKRERATTREWSFNRRHGDVNGTFLWTIVKIKKKKKHRILVILVLKDKKMQWLLAVKHDSIHYGCIDDII